MEPDEIADYRAQADNLCSDAVAMQTLAAKHGDEEIANACAALVVALVKRFNE